MQQINELTFDRTETQIVVMEGLLLAAWRNHAEGGGQGAKHRYLAETESIGSNLLALCSRLQELAPTTQH